MLNTTKRIAVAAAIAVFALPASAATFDFFGGANGANGNYNGNYSVTVDGIQVDVTAGIYNGLGSASNDDSIINSDCSGSLCTKVVHKNNGGLGVGGLFDSNQIDGRLGDDLITFTFSKVVDFASMAFSSVDGNDDFDLFIDGVLASEENNINSQNPFLAFGTGTSFSVGADAFGDDFRVASIQVSAVPLPASALLLMAGIGGLGAMRRRKN